MLSLARRLCLPTLQRWRLLRRRQWQPLAVPVSRLPSPDLADRRFAVRQHQAADDEVVSRDLLISQAKPSQAKTGLSALELKRHVGVSYPTAWLMPYKIMTAMATREAQRRLSGAVQVDDAYLGGERAGGKPGRGLENKVPFIVAFSLNDTGNPLYAKVTPVPGFTSDASPTDSTGASTSPSGSCGSLWASLGARPYRNASFGRLSFFTNQVR